jgi:hypothetical protein
MPYFIDGLGKVKECSGAVLLGFEGFVDPLDETVGLVDCGILLPEAELMSGDETVGGHQWEDTV